MQHDSILYEFMETEQNTTYDSESEESECDEDDQSEDVVKKINEINGDGLGSLMILVRCAAHTLQLAVHDVLRKTTSSDQIEQVRKVVKNLKSSRYLDKIPHELKSIRINVVTRWNSLYNMFESISSRQHIFEEFYAKFRNDRKDVYLPDSTFGTINHFIEAFKPVEECTKALQAEQLAMSK
jgi:hypothetical protein